MLSRHRTSPTLQAAQWVPVSAVWAVPVAAVPVAAAATKRTSLPQQINTYKTYGIKMDPNFEHMVHSNSRKCK